MGRIIFSLFILWGYLSNSLGGSRPGSFPLRGYVPPTLSSWCDTLHSSQIIAHSPHRARHQPQDQNTNRTPSTHERTQTTATATRSRSRATPAEPQPRSTAADPVRLYGRPTDTSRPGVRFLLRKRTQKLKHVYV